MKKVKSPPSSPPRQEAHLQQSSSKHSKESLVGWANTESNRHSHDKHDQQLKNVKKAPVVRLDDSASAAQKLLQSQKKDHAHN